MCVCRSFFHNKHLDHHSVWLSSFNGLEPIYCDSELVFCAPLPLYDHKIGHLEIGPRYPPPSGPSPCVTRQQNEHVALPILGLSFRVSLPLFTPSKCLSFKYLFTTIILEVLFYLTPIPFLIMV